MVQQCDTQEKTEYLLRVSVGSRNNEFICKVLDVLKEKKLPGSNGTFCLIEQDSDSKFWLGRAVLYATINDDCATLEGIADWARKENLDGENPKGDAMVLACLKDLRHCIEPLYKLNYRINLDEEDRKEIENLMKNQPNDWMLKFKEYFYPKSTEVTEASIPDEGRKGKKYDMIERYLSLKAHANPQYLAAEFRYHINASSYVSKYDPWRKSLGKLSIE